MGEWESKSPHWWTYRVPGLDCPYGHVVRHRRDGPEGAAWDAVVIAVHIGDDTTIAARVSLDEAKVAIEQHAMDHVGRA